MLILTGCNGFIGKAFCKELNNANLYKISSDNAFSFLESFDDWEKVELILHQGAISSTIETDLDKIYKYNIDFSIKLFKKAIKYKIPIKYASSVTVYGNQNDIINPLNYYAISKVIIDYWVNDHINEFKLVQGFRYFNVYGKGEENKGDQASPISKFTKQIRTTGKLNLFKGSENFFRDFIFVKDIVDIVLNNDAKSGIYDLGTGVPISFEQVAELVAKKENGEIKYIEFPRHLKGKYQGSTKANMDWLGDYKFTTIDEYLNGYQI
mgnify:CR=1 FL=1